MKWGRTPQALRQDGDSIVPAASQCGGKMKIPAERSRRSKIVTFHVQDVWARMTESFLGQGDER